MRARNTGVEEKILAFVNAYIEQNCICPSYREIARGVGLSSTATIHNHIKGSWTSTVGAVYLRSGTGCQ